MNRWTREQDLSVLYLRWKYGHQLAQSHPDIKRLADAMGRTEASIWMRKANFDSLDPSVPGGLRNAAGQTRDIYHEYQCDRNRVLAEARKSYSNLLSKST